MYSIAAVGSCVGYGENTGARVGSGRRGDPQPRLDEREGQRLAAERDALEKRQLVRRVREQRPEGGRCEHVGDLACEQCGAHVVDDAGAAGGDKSGAKGESGEDIAEEGVPRVRRGEEDA